VVSVLSKSQSRRCRVTVLGKVFTPIVPVFTKQRNWHRPSVRGGNCGPGGKKWQPAAGFMTHVTCRLIAKNRDQLRNPTLGNRVWATFNYLLPSILRLVSKRMRNEPYDGPQVPTSKDKAHHSDTATTLQPHHATSLVMTPHTALTFRKVVWCGCGVSVVCLVFGRRLALAGQLRSTQPCIPPGSLNRVPASAGLRAGMSPLPGGR